MNRTRESSLDGQQLDSTPKKKPRMELPKDEATELTLEGLDHLMAGSNDAAEKCFSEALGKLDNSFSFHVCRCKSRSDNLEQSSGSIDTVSGMSNIHHCTQGGMKGNGSGNLLYVYQRQEYDEGLYIYTEALALEDSQNELVRAATLLYNLALAHIHNGRYYEAKKCLEVAVVRLKIANEGENHALDFVRIYHNLGLCFYRMHKKDDALRCYRKALAISEKLTVRDFHVAAANVAIAVLFIGNNQKDVACSLELFESALTVYRSTFGASSKEVATILHNIGRVHYLKGNYDDALCAYDEALLIRRRCLCKCSIDLAATVCNTGQTHHLQGNLDSALKYYNEFLDLAHYNLVPCYHDVAIICKSKAEIYKQQGELKEAKAWYEKALEACRKGLGLYHPELSAILKKLGQLHYEMHDLDAALTYYSEGLDIEKVILDPCSPQLVVTLTDLARIQEQKGNYFDALLQYGEIHARQLHLFGPNSLEIAQVLSSIGMMEYQLGAHTAALQVFQASLSILREHYYPNDDRLDIASNLNSIGLILFHQGRLDRARERFIDCLYIRRKLLGPDHRAVGILWTNLATVYLKMGEDDVAYKFFKEALRIEERTPTPLSGKQKLDYHYHHLYHHHVTMILVHLGKFHVDRGDLDEALAYFSKALADMKLKQTSSHGTRNDCNNYSCWSQEIGTLQCVIGDVYLWKGNLREMMICYTEAMRLFRQMGQQYEALAISEKSLYGLYNLYPLCAAMA